MISITVPSRLNRPMPPRCLNRRKALPYEAVIGSYVVYSAMRLPEAAQRTAITAAEAISHLPSFHITSCAPSARALPKRSASVLASNPATMAAIRPNGPKAGAKKNAPTRAEAAMRVPPTKFHSNRPSPLAAI